MTGRVEFWTTHFARGLRKLRAARDTPIVSLPLYVFIPLGIAVVLPWGICALVVR